MYAKNIFCWRFLCVGIILFQRSRDPWARRRDVASKMRMSLNIMRMVVVIFKAPDTSSIAQVGAQSTIVLLYAAKNSFIAGCFWGALRIFPSGNQVDGLPLAPSLYGAKHSPLGSAFAL